MGQSALLEPVSRNSLPDEAGHFGPYGGMYVPETLMAPLYDLSDAYEEAKNDPLFQDELAHHLRSFGGRPTHLYFAERLTEFCGGGRKSTLSVRTCSIQAPTRSTTRLVKLSWPNAWANTAS